MDKISIVVACDNHYAVLLSVLIKSLEVNHHTDELLAIYIIDDGISLANKQKVIADTTSAKVELNWISKQNAVPANIRLPIDRSAFPLTAFLKIFAPYVVPEGTKKVIYLDVDMLVLKDISLLWHTDIGDYTLAAVTDLGETVSCSWGGIPNYRELGIPAGSGYFNSGLLVMNVEKWKSENIVPEILRAMKVNKEYVVFPDQYGLNVVLANRWFELDRNWNSFSAREYDDPYIIHFLDIKPVYRSYRSNQKFKEEFMKYLELTSWRGLKPQSDYKRLFRKVYNKVKKQLLSIAGRG